MEKIEQETEKCTEFYCKREPALSFGKRGSSPKKTIEMDRSSFYIIVNECYSCSNVLFIDRNFNYFSMFCIFTNKFSKI